MDLTKSKMPCHTRFNMTNKTQKLKVEMTGFEPASSLHPKCSGVPDSPTSRVINSTPVTITSCEVESICGPDGNRTHVQTSIQYELYTAFW